jgi:hypothetical protein
MERSTLLCKNRTNLVKVKIFCTVNFRNYLGVYNGYLHLTLLGSWTHTHNLCDIQKHNSSGVGLTKNSIPTLNWASCIRALVPIKQTTEFGITGLFYFVHHPVF